MTDFLLGECKILFKSHMGGGEALVVEEEGLDLAVLDGDSVFEVVMLMDDVAFGGGAG